MIYRFEPSASDSVLNSVIEWSNSHSDVELWRGRCDQPGQYRFDWRIRLSGRTELEFILRFSGELEFTAEPDYAV